jgi:hypothetical protein
MDYLISKSHLKLAASFLSRIIKNIESNQESRSVPPLYHC